MDISARDEDGSIILETEDKNHTVFNLFRHYLWKTGAEAGYNKGHPYIGQSQLVFDASDPEDAIHDAAEQVRENIESIREAFEA